MLSCLIARKLGARHTIARVRNPIYYRQIGLLKEDLHLSMAVNPELIVADEISRLLIFPDASQIETFVKGRMELLELPVSANGVLEGMRLSDMYRKFQIRLLVCAVERGEDVRIPDGEYVLKAGDRLHIAASHHPLKRSVLFFCCPCCNLLLLDIGRSLLISCKSICISSSSTCHGTKCRTITK